MKAERNKVPTRAPLQQIKQDKALSGAEKGNKGSWRFLRTRVYTRVRSLEMISPKPEWAEPGGGGAREWEELSVWGWSHRVGGAQGLSESRRSSACVTVESESGRSSVCGVESESGWS